MFGRGGGCVVVVVAPVSQWWFLFLSGGGLLVLEFFWPKYHIRLFDKFCIFPDMPPGLKPSQGGSPPSLKVWSKSNRGILRNG